VGVRWHIDQVVGVRWHIDHFSPLLSAYIV
jgi:hypothetical protein